MDVMGNIAFSVAGCSLAFTFIAYEKYVKLEKRITVLEDNEK